MCNWWSDSGHWRRKCPLPHLIMCKIPWWVRFEPVTSQLLVRHYNHTEPHYAHKCDWPAMARCIMKYFIRDLMPVFDMTIDSKIAMFPTTMATKRTITKIICSLCMHTHARTHTHIQRGGDWKRETWHRETIKIVGTDIARLFQCSNTCSLQVYFWIREYNMSCSSVLCL